MIGRPERKIWVIVGRQAIEGFLARIMSNNWGVNSRILGRGRKQEGFAAGQGLAIRLMFDKLTTQCSARHDPTIHYPHILQTSLEVNCMLPQKEVLKRTEHSIRERNKFIC